MSGSMPMETKVSGAYNLDGLGKVHFVTQWPKDHGDVFTATMRILRVKPWHQFIGGLVAAYAIWKARKAA